jgi:predicted metal-dependent hydrolase
MESFSPQDKRFFETMILGWKDEALETMVIEAMKEIFRSQERIKDKKRKSGYLNSVMSYFKSPKEDKSKAIPILETYFENFIEMQKEEENRLYKFKDKLFQILIKSIKVNIKDGENQVSLGIENISLNHQQNECFDNIKFTIESMNGTESTPSREGSK